MGNNVFNYRCVRCGVLAGAFWTVCLGIFSYSPREDVSPSSSVAKVRYGLTHLQDSTRTKMWWFHGYQPSTKEGMTRDLEAFKQVGIGGVVFYDQVHGTPAADSELAFSEPWWSNVYYAASEAQRLGLSFEFHVSNGFVAGGPWIGPAEGMKRVECLETLVDGPATIDLLLKAPQNKHNWYKDICLLAVPTFQTAVRPPQMTTNQPAIDPSSLFTRGKLVELPVPVRDSSVNVLIDYGRPVTVRSISYEVAAAGKATTSATNVPAPPQETFVGTGYKQLPPLGELQWSTDGQTFFPATVLKPLYKAHESYRRKTLSFPAVKARYFRLSLAGWEGSAQGKPLRMGGVTLDADARVNEYEYKAAYISEYVEHSMDSPAYTSEEAIPLNEVRDISTHLSPDGHLRWQVPAGRWKILRFCSVPTGASIKHGRANLGGLECDKLSAAAAELQFNSYFRVILDSLEQHGLYNLKGMAMDSHEAGSQNWTEHFLEEFCARRGYALERYLPVMAGYVVEDVRTSEAVLYDVRQTIADLVADCYYGTFQRLCQERGVTYTAQATGNAQCIVATPLVAKGKVDKPQGEFWHFHPDGNYDVKEAASAAHLYGKTVASAEAFTDAPPEMEWSQLKVTADAAYAFGANEFVVCASAHQPTDGTSGNNGGRGYNTFCRNNPRWSASTSFWEYQARMAYAMRQGRPVADLCVYLGDNPPVRILTHRLPEIPAGYDFDVFTQEALLNRMEATEEGKIGLPTGQQYALMVLPRSGEITLAALQKIAELVSAGALVYGNYPTGSPALCDRGKEAEYQALARALWTAPAYGKGRVYGADKPLSQVLGEAGIVPDVEGPALYFAHRQVSDGDLYFLHNHAAFPQEAVYRFKTSYHQAELWDATTGTCWRIPCDEGTVTLAFRPYESFLLVFF